MPNCGTQRAGLGFSVNAVPPSAWRPYVRVRAGARGGVDAMIAGEHSVAIPHGAYAQVFRYFSLSTRRILFRHAKEKLRSAGVRSPWGSVTPALTSGLWPVAHDLHRIGVPGSGHSADQQVRQTDTGNGTAGGPRAASPHAAQTRRPLHLRLAGLAPATPGGAGPTRPPAPLPQTRLVPSSGRRRSNMYRSFHPPCPGSGVLPRTARSLAGLAGGARG
jgi:hypothetical protein